MIVYLDLVIISTIIVNYAFIKTISLIFKEKMNIIKIILGLILSVLSLLLFILPSSIYNLRYFVGIIIGIVSFKYDNIQNFIIKIALFYLLNMAFIGTLVIFNIHNIILMLIALLYVLILFILENYKKYNSNIYHQVKINNILINAILDTGNETYYQGVPIVFIKNKYFNNEFKLIGSLAISNVNSIDIINIYDGPLIKTINNEKEMKVYYAFSDTIQYDLILHQELGGII